MKTTWRLNPAEERNIGQTWSALCTWSLCTAAVVVMSSCSFQLKARKVGDFEGSFYNWVQSSQFYSNSLVSQITICLKGLLQSVQHTAPSILGPSTPRRKNSPTKSFGRTFSYLIKASTKGSKISCFHKLDSPHFFTSLSCEDFHIMQSKVQEWCRNVILT